MTSETRPAFPFYCKDWLASTRGLSGAARGYHIDMLALSWLNGGCDIDQDTLRRSVGAEKAEWRRVWPELAARWHEVGGRLVNRKLESVRHDLDEYRDAKSKAGAKGGKASAAKRAEGKHEASTSQADGQAERNPASASPTPSPTSSIDDDTESASAWTPGQLRHASLDVLDLWRRFGTGSSVESFEKLSWKDKRDIVDALKRRSLSEWESLFQRAAASDYLTGRDGQRQPMTLWKVLEEASKIAAGAYDNLTPRTASPTNDLAPSKWSADVVAAMTAQQRAQKERAS